jgi:hypothetical protein
MRVYITVDVFLVVVVVVAYGRIIVRCCYLLFMQKTVISAWMLLRAAAVILCNVNIWVASVGPLLALLDWAIIATVRLGHAEVRHGCDGVFEAPEPLVAVLRVRNRGEVSAAAVEEEGCCEVLILAAHGRCARIGGRRDGLDGVHIGGDADDAGREEERFIAVVGHVDDIALHRAAATMEQVESFIDVE